MVQEGKKRNVGFLDSLKIFSIVRRLESHRPGPYIATGDSMLFAQRTLLLMSMFFCLAVRAETSVHDFQLVKAWWVGSRSEVQLQLEDSVNKVGMIVNFSMQKKIEPEVFYYSMTRSPTEPEVALNTEELRSILLRALANRGSVDLNIYKAPPRIQADVETAQSSMRVYHAGIIYPAMKSSVPQITKDNFYSFVESYLKGHSLNGNPCSALLNPSESEN
jgi:hypothetical protein